MRNNYYHGLNKFTHVFLDLNVPDPHFRLLKGQFVINIYGLLSDLFLRRFKDIRSLGLQLNAYQPKGFLLIKQDAWEKHQVKYTTVLLNALKTMAVRHSLSSFPTLY